MSDSEWQECTRPKAMLACVSNASHRKLILYAAACCGCVKELLVDARSRSALAALRRAADGRADRVEMQREADDARRAVWAAGRAACLAVMSAEEYERESQLSRALSTGPTMSRLELIADQNANVQAARAVFYAAETVLNPDAVREVWFCAAWAMALDAGSHEMDERKQPVLAQLVREVFSSPTQSVVVEPEWQTEAVLAIARGAYVDQAFERLPILADALQDAGCESERLLDHCRLPGVHVRGCWVVDLILGRDSPSAISQT